MQRILNSTPNLKDVIKSNAKNIPLFQNFYQVTLKAHLLSFKKLLKTNFIKKLLFSENKFEKIKYEINEVFLEGDTELQKAKDISQKYQHWFMIKVSYLLF